MFAIKAIERLTGGNWALILIWMMSRVKHAVTGQTHSLVPTFWKPEWNCQRSVTACSACFDSVNKVDSFNDLASSSPDGPNFSN